MNITVTILAWTSFILALASYGFGAIAIIKKAASPSIISRFFWLVLSITNYLSYLSLGAGSGIFLSLAGTMGSGVIFLLSIRNGYIEFKRSDIIAIIGSVIALSCYLLIPIKLISLLAGLLTHFISGVPTYKKTWVEPHTENLPFWALFCIASLCSLIGVILQSKNLIYPLYFFFFDAGMAILIILKRKKLKQIIRNELVLQ